MPQLSTLCATTHHLCYLNRAQKSAVGRQPLCNFSWLKSALRGWPTGICLVRSLVLCNWTQRWWHSYRNKDNTREGEPQTVRFRLLPGICHHSVMHADHSIACTIPSHSIHHLLATAAPMASDTRCLSSGWRHLLYQLSSMDIGHWSSRPVKVSHYIQYHTILTNVAQYPNTSIVWTLQLSASDIMGISGLSTVSVLLSLATGLAS